MKKIMLCGLMALAALTVSITSCNKYVDGPKVSLLTKKARVVNTWAVEKWTSTNSAGVSTDLTSLVTDYTFVVEKDGGYTVTWGSFTDSGTWELGEDKDDLKLLSSQSGSTEEAYRILRLKSKEMWLKYTYSNGDVDEVHYKQK